MRDRIDRISVIRIESNDSIQVDLRLVQPSTEQKEMTVEKLRKAVVMIERDCGRSVCQARIQRGFVKAGNGAQSTGYEVKLVLDNQFRWPVALHAKKCRSPFFQISAETVGITKKGAMTRMRTMPWPHMG